MTIPGPAKGSLKVGAAFLQTLVTQVAQSAASILTGILIARGLGPAGQGRYAVVAAAVALGVIFASLGQFEGNVLSSAGVAASGRPLLMRSWLQSSTVGFILLLTVPLWHNRLGVADAWIPVAFTVVLALEIEAQLVRGINLGQHHIASYNLITLVQRFAYLTAVVTLRVVGLLRLQTVLAAWAGAAMLSQAVASAWVWVRSGKAPVSLRGMTHGLKRDLRRGARALITISATLLLVRCDIWMLGPMLGVRFVGQMSVASTLAEWLWYVPSILGNVLFAAGAGDRTRIAVRISRASRAVVTLILPALVILEVVGRRLVPTIYGAAYGDAGVLFVILLPGMAAVAVHLVVDSYFSGKGFPAVSIWGAIGALGAKAGLNLIAIPLWGAPGAAMVTTAVYTSLLFFKVFFFTRETGVSVRALIVPTWNETRETMGTAWLWATGLVKRAPAH